MELFAFLLRDHPRRNRRPRSGRRPEPGAGKAESRATPWGGPGSRFSQVYSDFGFAATQAPIEDGGSHGEEISQEFFVQYNPGTIFVLDRAKAIGEDQAPAMDVLNNGLVGTTDAAKNGTIVEIDGFSWYLAPNAPSSWQDMIDDARSALD